MNYQIEAILILLNQDCLLSRYFPLIPYKEKILKTLKENGISDKEEALKNADLLVKIFENEQMAGLFQNFLTLYDVKPAKLKELGKLALSEEEKSSFEELYLLPGVKETRARLYFLSGLKHLKDFTDKTPEQILSLTQNAILQHALPYQAPLPKEIKTHIAVAKTFSDYAVKNSFGKK